MLELEEKIYYNLVPVLHEERYRYSRSLDIGTKLVLAESFGENPKEVKKLEAEESLTVFRINTEPENTNSD